MQNKEWVFSGIGVFALGIFCALIKWLSQKNKQSEHPSRIKSCESDFISPSRSVKIRYAKPKDLNEVSHIAAHYLGEDHAVLEKTAKGWYQRNPEMCRVVECFPSPRTGKNKWGVCGYYVTLPIVNSTFELLRQGKIEDFQINAESIKKFSDPDVSSLYIMDLMTSTKYCPNRGCAQIAGSYLLRDLVWRVDGLLNENSNIKSVATITASDNGKKLVQKFGFKRDENYNNDIGWEFWGSSVCDLNLYKAKKHMPILEAQNRFQEEYTI